MSEGGMGERIAPMADILILLGALIVVGGAFCLILIKVAAHRKERTRRKVSKSRRGTDTRMNLFGSSETDQAPSSNRGNKRRRRRSSSSHYGIDILKRNDAPEGEPDTAPQPGAGSS